MCLRGDWSSACRQVFKVPVLRDSISLDAQDPKWRNNGYGRALSAGFQLRWDRSSGECSRCEQSSGKCGYSQAGEFVRCLCADGHVDGDGCGGVLSDSTAPSSGKPLRLS
jgi:hypothetical protein